MALRLSIWGKKKNRKGIKLVKVTELWDKNIDKTVIVTTKAMLGDLKSGLERDWEYGGTTWGYGQGHQEQAIWDTRL